MHKRMGVVEHKYVLFVSKYILHFSGAVQNKFDIPFISFAKICMH